MIRELGFCCWWCCCCWRSYPFQAAKKVVSKTNSDHEIEIYLADVTPPEDSQGDDLAPPESKVYVFRGWFQQIPIPDIKRFSSSAVARRPQVEKLREETLRIPLSNMPTRAIPKGDSRLFCLVDKDHVPILTPDRKLVLQREK